jgi:hypothetical protein
MPVIVETRMPVARTAQIGDQPRDVKSNKSTNRNSYRTMLSAETMNQ